MRLFLTAQGTWILSLVQEDPTCHGATKSGLHNYSAYALEPGWAPHALNPVLANKRDHHNEKPAHHS